MAKNATALTDGLFANVPSSGQNVPAQEPFSSRSKAMGRPKMEKKEQKNFYLSLELAKKLRIYAAVNGQAQSDIVEDALKAYFQFHSSEL